MVDRAGLAAVPKPIGVDRRWRPCVASSQRSSPGRAPSTRAGWAGHAPGTAKVIQDGHWIAGDDEQDQPLADGTFVLTWQFHWVSGWAPQHGEYRATMADSYGNAEVYRGHLEG
jgi:hypothetical protein